MGPVILRPGKSIEDYLHGKRKNHFKPIAYVLLLTTIYFLISKMTNQNTWIDDFISGFTIGAYNTSGELKLGKIVAWFANNYAYTTLLLIPVFSLASYVCFSKYKLNYLEHIVLNCYITGQQAIFYLLFSLLHAALDYDLIELFQFFVTMAYSFYVFLQFFDKENRIAIIIRGLLTYILYSIFSLIVLLLVMGIQELVVG